MEVKKIKEQLQKHTAYLKQHKDFHNSINDLYRASEQDALEQNELKETIHLLKTELSNYKGELESCIHSDIEEERKYRDLFEKMADGIYKSTQAGKFIEVNPALVKMLGYDSKEELLAIDIKKDLYFDESEREGTGDVGEDDDISIFRLKKKDGTEIWVEDRGQYISDENGNVLYHEGNLRDVTSRVMAQRRLMQSQKETADYRKALDQSLIVAITNKEGKIIYANENLSKISQFSNEELIGKDHRFINFNGENDDSIIDQDRTVETGKVWRGEIKKRAKDGKPYWVDQTVIPFINDEGQIYQYLSLRIDITEKKSAEIIMREREENFRTIIQSSNDLIQSLNRDGSFDFVNASWMKKMGYSEEELKQMKISDVISEEYKEKCALVFQRVLGGEKIDDIKTVFKTESQQKVILEGNVVPRIKNNVVVGVQTFLRDVTEREVAEAQTAVAKEQLELKIEQLKESQEIAQLGTWTLDLKTGISEHSEEFYKIFERTKEDFMIPLDQQLSFFYEEDIPQIQFAFISAIKESKPYKFETRIQTPNGKIKEIFAAGKVSTDCIGIPLKLQGTIQDITERKKQEYILKESLADLKKTNSELDKFVYSVSHDLRAPLSSMLGVIELSEDDTNDEQMLDHLKMLKNNINKLDGFILDILDYSRNARIEIKKEEINFKEMVNDITQNLKYMGGANRMVDIKVEVSDKSKVNSDKTRLSIILNNLVSNAIRYQNSQIPNPFVDIKIDTSDTETGIIIRDNGIGIGKEAQAKVFNMFYRVSESSVGSGLGLYIVREAIEKLQGEIAIDSELGVGTTFIIKIPNN